MINVCLANSESARSECRARVLRGADEGEDASAACARGGSGDLHGGNDGEVAEAAARRTEPWQT
jgi:hypothetical protein